MSLVPFTSYKKGSNLIAIFYLGKNSNIISCYDENNSVKLLIKTKKIKNIINSCVILIITSKSLLYLMLCQTSKSTYRALGRPLSV